MYKLFRYKALYRDRCLLKIGKTTKLILFTGIPSIVPTTFGPHLYFDYRYLYLKNVKHAYVIYMGIR